MLIFRLKSCEGFDIAVDDPVLPLRPQAILWRAKSGTAFMRFVVPSTRRNFSFMYVSLGR